MSVLSLHGHVIGLLKCYRLVEHLFDNAATNLLTSNTKGK